MPREFRQKLVFRLRARDMIAIIRLLGPQCRYKWWFREWLRRQEGDLTRSEYRELMESGRASRPPVVRDWGDDE